MKILNKETNQIRDWTMSEILTEINRDRSGDWIDYDETDWLEGWMFWVEENEDESCYKLLDKHSVNAVNECVGA
jgi:hypothetical protein